MKKGKNHRQKFQAGQRLGGRSELTLCEEQCRSQYGERELDDVRRQLHPGCRCGDSDPKLL